MILDIDGTITSPILESLIGKSLACKNIFIDTLVVQVTGDSLMMYQLINEQNGWIRFEETGRLLNEDLKSHGTLRLKY